MIAASALAAAAVFYIAFPWWIERILKSDRGVQQRLRLVVANDRVGWSITPSDVTPRPYAPLIGAVLAGTAVIAAQAALFASTSRAPHLWLIAGAIAAAILLLASLVTMAILKRPLRRTTDRALKRHAANAFWFAMPTIVEICEISEHMDMTYASIGLRARSNARDLCVQALVQHARSGQNVALAQAMQIKEKAADDLRNLQYLARVFSNIKLTIEKAGRDPSLSGNAQGAISQIDNQVHSGELEDALKDARWSHADRMLEAIGLDLGRVLDIDGGHALIPETLEDAYQILNVSDDTPLDNIKAVVTTYRRIWHPDLALNDEVKHERCLLRMQQINAAWDIIQKARTKRLSHASAQDPSEA